MGTVTLPRAEGPLCHPSPGVGGRDGATPGAPIIKEEDGQKGFSKPQGALEEPALG